MRWRFDDFEVREEDPSHEGIIRGNTTDEQLVPGANTLTKKNVGIALNVDFDNNYIFFRAAIADSIADISAARLGFSAAFFLRIVNRSDIVIMSNMEPGHDGFSFYQENGTCIFLVRYNGYEWEIRTILPLYIWNHVTMTWKEEWGSKLYINKADVDWLGGFYEHRLSTSSPPINESAHNLGLYVGISPLVGRGYPWGVENLTTAEIAMDDMRFAPEYVYKMNIINMLYRGMYFVQ